MMFSDLLYRLRSLFGRKRMEADLDEEVRLHFDRQVDKFVQEGMPRQEASRQARLLLGGIDEVKEECRDARGISFFETATQDLRFGRRSLRSNRSFTAAAVLSFSLAIGASAALFSVVQAKPGGSDLASCGRARGSR